MKIKIITISSHDFSIQILKREEMKIATVIELFGLAHFLDVVYLVEVVELGVYVYVFRDDCNRFRGHHINDTAHDMNLFNK